MRRPGSRTIVAGGNFIKDWLPIVTWMSEYQRSWLRNDINAGFTIWAVLVPLAMACAVLVGVEPIVGLYTLPLALLGYAIFGGSRLLVVEPDTAVAVLSGSIIASFAVGGSELLAFAVVLALIAGVVYVLFFLLKMGWIADLIPEPVLKGFAEGVVWLTLLKQLNGLLGLGLDAAPKELHRAYPAQSLSCWDQSSSSGSWAWTKRVLPCLAKLAVGFQTLACRSASGLTVSLPWLPVP